MMKTKTVTLLGSLLAIALVVQSLHLPTGITGPAINAVLIVSAAFAGLLGSVSIGFITPLAALLMGIIKPVAAPMIPVIMTANATLVMAFYLLRKRNNYLAIMVAALAKYFVFYISLNYIIVLLGINIPKPMLAAFQLPQLLTALAGGALGVGIIKYMDKLFQIQDDVEMQEEKQ